MSATMVVGFVDAGRPEQGVGAATIQAIRRLDPDNVDLVTWRGDATRLADRWSGAGLVILIDGTATATAGPAIRVQRRSLRHPSMAGHATPGVHGQLIQDAVNLGAAFGHLPPTLLLYIVDTAARGIGAAPVEAAIRSLAIEIAEEATGHGSPAEPRSGFVPRRPPTKPRTDPHHHGPPRKRDEPRG